MLWYVPIFRNQVMEEKQRKDWPELVAGDCLKSQRGKLSKKDSAIGSDITERKVNTMKTGGMYTGSSENCNEIVGALTRADSVSG